MQLHQLKPKSKNKKRKRVGRGGKRGAYSGRGMKGQSARAGRKMQPSIRELIKKFPKLRGYRSESFEKNIAIISIGAIVKKFESNEVVSPKTLLEKKLIRRIRGRTPKVKILGNEKIEKSFAIENCQVSASAKKSIESAGGTIK